MNRKLAVEVIKHKFERIDRPVRIPLQKGRSFKGVMPDKGIVVDNLGGRPLIPWIVFEEVIDLLIRRVGNQRMEMQWIVNLVMKLCHLSQSKDISLIKYTEIKLASQLRDSFPQSQPFWFGQDCAILPWVS